LIDGLKILILFGPQKKARVELKIEVFNTFGVFFFVIEVHVSTPLHFERIEVPRDTPHIFPHWFIFCRMLIVKIFLIV